MLKCGYVRQRKNGICYFEVVKLKDIIDRVIPFFREFPLRSEKKIDFEIFSEIAEMIEKKQHLTKKGIKKILKLRELMNKGGKNRRLKIEDIFKNIK